MNQINTEILSSLTSPETILPAEEQIRLLIVDDEETILRTLQRLFHNKPYEVHLANGGEDALNILAKTTVDVIISDMRMPGMDGLEFLQNVEALYPDTRRIILSAYADPQTVIHVVNEVHIYSYVNKPWDDLDLKLKVKNAAQELYLERLSLWQNAALIELNNSLEEKVQQRTAELVMTLESLQQAYHELDAKSNQ